MLSRAISSCIAVVALVGCTSGATPDASVAADVSVADAPADTAVNDAVVEDRAPLDAAPEDVAEDVSTATDVQCPPSDGRRPCVHNVSGRVTDTTGAGLSGKVVTVCGTVCYSERSNPDGTFRVPVEDLLDVPAYTVSVHGRPEFATTYVPMPAPVNGEVVFAQPISVPRLTETGPQMPDPAVGGTVTAGDVTLTVPAGGRFEYDLEDVVIDALGRQFRYGTHNPHAYPAYAPSAVGVIYGFGPFALISTRPIAVSVVNREMLAAGTAVDFVPMGIEIVTPPITGGRALAGIPGHVSADGRTVATDPGAGVTLLTWLAIVPRR